MKASVSTPKFFHKPWMTIAVSTICTCISVAVIFSGETNKQYDSFAGLDRMATGQQWEKILEAVTPKVAKADPYKRKYALLALSETGRLAEDAFKYGLTGAEDFYFEKPDNILAFNFNMIFYRSLGMENPLIMHGYQQQTLSKTGMTFSAIRALTDSYLRLNDHALAKKYIDMLAHSTCHRKWVKERLPMLEAIKGTESEYRLSGERFVMQTFLVDMVSMTARLPQNRKFADYLLCGILSEKDGNKFLHAFQGIAPTLYPEGKDIPRLYQEALCPITSQIEGLNYQIDDSVWASFMDFNELVSQRKQSQAKRKHADTYWAYVFF